MLFRSFYAVSRPKIEQRGGLHALECRVLLIETASAYWCIFPQATFFSCPSIFLGGRPFLSRRPQRKENCRREVQSSCLEPSHVVFMRGPEPNSSAASMRSSCDDLGWPTFCRISYPLQVLEGRVLRSTLAMLEEE